jgi:hypothetical protein
VQSGRTKGSSGIGGVHDAEIVGSPSHTRRTYTLYSPPNTEIQRYSSTTMSKAESSASLNSGKNDDNEVEGKVREVICPLTSYSILRTHRPPMTS